MFDAVVDARLLKRGKPGSGDLPEGGKPARRRSQQTASASKTAVAGVASIKGAGMAALGIGRPSVLTEADAVIPSLDDFLLGDYLA
jgi:hypothetical protein